MRKKKIAALIAALVVTLSCLSACTVQGKTSNSSNNLSIATTAKADDFVPKTRIFEPGTHMYTRRFTYRSVRESTDTRIPVPDGYQVFAVNNWNENRGGGAYTAGFDVVYVNIERVEAKTSQREHGYQKYTEDYYDPGVVITDEKILVITNQN